MTEFGALTRVDLRDMWPNEASNFTPWLANNIEALGKAIGIELELETTEAAVGDFSLDLLARNLGTGRLVVIENQLTQTDHDHLGKLLTYAAGFSAATVIWVAESFREEHRQAMDWLNQRTGEDTQCFGVVIEILKIDDSKPAYNFKPVVFPNEWQKSKVGKTGGTVSSKGAAYQRFFQGLIDELREQHHFTGAKKGQPQNWYSFSTGVSGALYGAVFSQGNKARVEVYIDLGDGDVNLAWFESLRSQKDVLEGELGAKLEWEPLESKRACRIALYRDGAIESSDEELESVKQWMIANLLTLKKVFVPRLQELANQSSQHHEN